ncbi:AtMMH-1 [Russula ochroleuca]|uniref:AtMMH-1 n=1 Tax=Russula ochroleuca TaxID=152965 RepID=A0A9P5TA05_9AGAM|nr:AtMMH-1 [Russula ochroleuca]
MPELPEVERAAALLRSIGLNRQIKHVETVEDKIVYAGATHDAFQADEITGRTIKAVGRYGKVFYIELDGEGRHPVLHFGMTGMLQIRGNMPVHYREAPRKASTEWPPRFMKFIIHLGPASSDSGEVTEVAFLDARRLGRIRLCKTPLAEPPISNMGFDPILSMPDMADFSRGVLRRTCPIKALLLDQSFSAGVGNWVADEVLYHARIHPEQRCNTLSEEQIQALHLQIRNICTFAVEVNADDSKFPDNWLFKYRWGKGKKAKEGDDSMLKLPDGRPATIKWITVGGRTSAYVVELQRLLRNSASQKLKKNVDSSQSTSPEIETVRTTRKRVKKETSARKKQRL